MSKQAKRRRCGWGAGVECDHRDCDRDDSLRAEQETRHTPTPPDNLDDFGKLKQFEAQERARMEAFEAMREALQRIVRAHNDSNSVVVLSIPMEDRARAALALADKTKG